MSISANKRSCYLDGSYSDDVLYISPREARSNMEANRIIDVLQPLDHNYKYKPSLRQTALEENSLKNIQESHQNITGFIPFQAANMLLLERTFI